MYDNAALGPQPDLNTRSSRLGLTTSSSRAHGTGAEADSSVLDQSQRATNMDELTALRRELVEAREARAQADAERDAMADDLLKAEETAEEKDEELQRLTQEALNWKARAEKLSKDLARSKDNAALRVPRAEDGAELAQARQQIDNLTTALAESNAKVAAHSSMEVDEQHPSQDLQSQFQARLAEVENHWRSQLIEEHKLRQAAKASLINVQTEFEQKLRSVESQMQHHKVVDFNSTQELEHLRRQVIDQERKLEDQHQCAEQFRRMSERLTTEVKQVNQANRDLKQSEEDLRRLAENLKSQIAPLHGPRRTNMPGSFHGLA